MKKMISNLARRLRQWQYPLEFRIEADERVAWPELLNRAVAEAVEAAEKAASAQSRDPPVPAPAPGNDFFVEFCNSNFRLRRNVEQLEKERESSKTLRRIRGALDKVETILDRAGVESIDLTGERYEEGRLDFQSLATEEIPGLQEMEISLCERPLILLQGQMIQRATGVVARPAQVPKTEVES